MKAKKCMSCGARVERREAMFCRRCDDSENLESIATSLREIADIMRYGR